MEALRSSLNLYAYNILGSYEEAKDVVQDVFERFSGLDQAAIADKKSYLIRMVINQSIDEKRRQKARRRVYPGPWLPEPVATDDPQRAVYRKEILSYSLMVLMERLDGKQRAVFILKEAFDYGHEEIAGLLGISAENSRKILSRAKEELRDGVSAPERDMKVNTFRQYVQAIETGDMEKLERLLRSDVAVTSDGGGKAAALRKVVRGVRSVRLLLAGLYRKVFGKLHSQAGWVNHHPAVFYYLDGVLISCQIISVRDSQLDNIFIVRNPDKLQALRKMMTNPVTFS